MNDQRHSLDVESIVESAEIASGTRGHVDDALRRRIGTLVDTLAQPGFGALDRALSVRRQIIQILARRLSIAGDIAKHPEILDEEIVAPIFVIGFARSGTTLLHSLLGADPAHRIPVAWRVREPSPPPGEQPVAPHRLHRATQDVFGFVDRCPGLLALHPYWDAGAETAIEDEEIFTLDFLNAYPSLLYNAQSLAVIEPIADADAAYAFLRQFMQHQQWRCPKRRWVMKGVEHQRNLAALFRAFPDARCIWPHREPKDILPSNLAITAAVYDGITEGALTRRELGPGFIQDFKATVLRLLDDPAIDDPRVLHIGFHDIASDPLGAVQDAYRRWGDPLRPDAIKAMRGWLDDTANRSDRYGRHRYDFASFGVDWADHDLAFDAYRLRFLGRKDQRTDHDIANPHAQVTA